MYETVAIRKIYKTTILDMDTTVQLPIGAIPLRVDQQHDVPTIWWLVNPEAKFQKTRIITVGTGESFDVAGFTYVGTAVCNDGRLIWHLFMETSVKSMLERHSQQRS